MINHHSNHIKSSLNAFYDSWSNLFTLRQWQFNFRNTIMLVLLLNYWDFANTCIFDRIWEIIPHTAKFAIILYFDGNKRCKTGRKIKLLQNNFNFFLWIMHVVGCNLWLYENISIMHWIYKYYYISYEYCILYDLCNYSYGGKILPKLFMVQLFWFINICISLYVKKNHGDKIRHKGWHQFVLMQQKNLFPWYGWQNSSGKIMVFGKKHFMNRNFFNERNEMLRYCWNLSARYFAIWLSLVYIVIDLYFKYQLSINNNNLRHSKK